MCQAYEGELSYLIARDRSTRQRGYDAQKAGIPRADCPEREHPNPEYSDARQWLMGWDTAARGGAAW